jgi:FtsH-binding integral membrane protein
MSIFNFIGQMLLGAPFVVFAYWYEREEALFQSKQTYPHTIYRHAAFGLLFSISFAVLGMLFFPPIMGITVLVSCIYIFIRSLDNIEEDRVSASTTSKRDL